MILVTGGAGFIGSNFIRNRLNKESEPIINLDKLTYAGNLQNLASLKHNSLHTFVRGDISDGDLVSSLLKAYQPRAVVNFAAETHVDRSIKNAESFIHTNINGTFSLLESVRKYWEVLPLSRRLHFRFLHISTDEVYGSLSLTDKPFSETSIYQPNSPYSASKAASDHLVRAWHYTHGLPTLTINSSNNYGPYQFPEKLIPLVIFRALSDKQLPIYGDGQQVRDWLYVEDHCDAIDRVLNKGRQGEAYNVGGGNQKTNIEVVTTLCALLDERHPRQNRESYTCQITFVPDRLGHDRRYAIDSGKLQHELGWKPKETFESGIRKTVEWYLNNFEWVKNVNK